MKKAMITVAVAIMMMFGVANVGADCEDGIRGLEITGGSAVGVVGYSGSSYTRVNTDNCSGDSYTNTYQTFKGVNVMTSANGSGCVNRDGSSSVGSVNGTGNFSAYVGGSDILGSDVSFYTKSKVTINANTNGGWN